MHLVGPLCSGVVGAANGSATLVQRGTTAPVTYYRDFEAAQPTTGTVNLDANGSAVVYVNQLADVRVLDVNGALLREFVAGDEAPAVEVISRSFTGTSYSDGSTGTSKPTTLQAVLDLWLTSAGKPDFNVSVAGVSVTLQAAVAGLAGLFFNVKSYGAIGDGVADDGASITAAINAAAAAGTAGLGSSTGGIVFFPPGRYRSTSTISVTGGVSLLGAGSHCVDVTWDNAALTQGMLLIPGGQAVSIGTVSGLKFDTVNTNFVNPLVQHAGGIWSISDCGFGGASTTKCQCLFSNASSQIVVTRCGFTNNANVQLVRQNGTGRIDLIECSLTLPAGTYTLPLVDLTDGANVEGCRFDGSAVNGGAGFKYIQFAPTATWGGCRFVGNRFASNAVPIPVTALFNSLATPIYDCFEDQNFFGEPAVAVTPYGYTTDGYASLLAMFGTHRAHGSRVGRVADYVSAATPLTLDAKSFGTAIVVRSGAGAQTLIATKGSLGDKFVVALLNESGGALTFTFGSPDFALDAGTTTIVVNPGTRGYVMFEWLAVNPNATTGQWVQISKSTTNVA